MAAKTSSDNTPNIKCQPKFESHIFSSDALNSLDIEDTPPIKSKCEHKSTLGTLLVAAIDFGTTFSGVAWQYRDGFKRYPLQIQTKCWGVSNRGGFPSIKIPTSLLLKPSKEFVAFGNEAEDEYAELADDNAHFGFYYFKNFKMLLYNAKKLCRTTMMSDEQGHEIHAKDVFMYCIRYLKEVVIEELEKSGGLVDEHEIHWVLTVPAIWNEAAKQFMREAAKEAGIPFNRITLALEPEAAAIYTKESLANRSRGPDGIHIQPYPPGTKYMVLDLGGGTVDVTVREVLEDRSLKELHKASGNDWGGRQVNIQFFRFLDEIFGKDVMNELRQRKSEFLDLERSVELKKRTQGKNGRITVDYPAILKDIYKEKRGKDLNN